jgi:hypothetical protein
MERVYVAGSRGLGQWEVAHRRFFKIGQPWWPINAQGPSPLYGNAGCDQQQAKRGKVSKINAVRRGKRDED